MSSSGGKRAWNKTEHIPDTIKQYFLRWSSILSMKHSSFDQPFFWQPMNKNTRKLYIDSQLLPHASLIIQKCYLLSANDKWKNAKNYWILLWIRHITAHHGCPHCHNSCPGFPHNGLMVMAIANRSKCHYLWSNCYTANRKMTAMFHFLYI
jgi:hypothetical protein